MESIERIPPPQQHDMDGSDMYMVTMREFLDKPRVARDFQDLKADAQRLESIGHECEQLNAGAAEVELEAGKVARIHDTDRQHRLDFRFGVALAAFFVMLDAIPANLAAQAFGLDVLPTWGITAVIVGALGAGMWAVTHYRTGPGRTVTIAALSIGLIAIGALRYWFLWVTAGDAFAAVLEAVALTVFTTMMVWLGILVLTFTKSRQVSAAERRARGLRRRAERKVAKEGELSRKLEAARSEFVADAQLFSFRKFQNDARRNQFLEYVRAELAR
jgi:hypothetical protein